MSSHIESEFFLLWAHSDICNALFSLLNINFFHLCSTFQLLQITFFSNYVNPLSSCHHMIIFVFPYLLCISFLNVYNFDIRIWPLNTLNSPPPPLYSALLFSCVYCGLPLNILDWKSAREKSASYYIMIYGCCQNTYHLDSQLDSSRRKPIMWLFCYLTFKAQPFMLLVVSLAFSGWVMSSSHISCSANTKIDN